MKQRIIWGTLLGILVLFALYQFSAFYLLVCLTLVLLYASWEWAKLCQFPSAQFEYGYVAAVAVVGVLFFYFPAALVLVLGFLACVWLWLGTIAYQQGWVFCGLNNYWVKGVIGGLLLIATWSALLILKVGQGLGPYYLLVGMTAVWVSDSGGYFTGKWLGQQTLVSRISPKKTREGFIGAVVSGLVYVYILSFFRPYQLGGAWHFMFMMFWVVVAGVAGDLMISFVKRLADVKDTGHLIPGHGGLLDRLDSIMAAMIMMALLFTQFPLWFFQ